MKRLRTILLCLVLGAIINVLVAWALSLWSPILRTVQDERTFQGPIWWSYWGSDMEVEPLPVVYSRGIGFDITFTGADLYGCQILRSGLPFRSLECSWEYLEGGFELRTLKDGTVVVVEVLTNWGLHASFDDFDPLLGPWPKRQHLPLRPIWIGLLLNTLFFGLFIFLVVPILVRSYRRFRGRCVICRYLLTGNTSGICPECGTVIKKAKPA